MGEFEFKDFTICYQDKNGEMKPLTSWNLNKNGLSWTIGSDKKQMEASENIVNNTDITLEFSPAVCSNDFTHLLEIPETHYEFAEELKEELKEISREESQKIIDEKWYQWTTDTIEAIYKGLQKSKEVGISAAEAIEKFAENAKKIYNKEKEKKGEEMKKKSAFSLPIVGVRFQNSTKTYAYFVTKEVLETYFRHMSNCCNLTAQYFLPYVTITNEVGYNYKNSKVMFIGLAKTPMMLNCPTHIITEINYDFSKAVRQEDDDFCPFEKCNLAEEDWFEKIAIYPVPRTLSDEYFNSKYCVAENNYVAVKSKKENKGDNKMNFNKIFPNAEIGKAKGVKMSIYGPAFHTYEEREVAFKDGEWIDVTGLTFDFCPAYVCPVKASEIAVGDFIKHLNCWCRVIGIDGVNITTENIAAHEVITILPVKSMFGFDFYSKLIIPFGDVTANIGDAFSNPFMTMMLFGDDSKDFNNLLPLMLMSGGKFDMSNPMMLYFLMKENKRDSAERVTGRELCF